MSDLVQKLVGALERLLPLACDSTTHPELSIEILDARAALSAAKDGGWVAVQGQPVAWQHEDGSASFISHRTKVTNQADHKWPYYYSIPLYRAVDEFPDGFVVVPVEPTEAMQNAGALAHQCSPAHDFIGPIHDAYAAMLAARPLPNPPKEKNT